VGLPDWKLGIESLIVSPRPLLKEKRLL
jgi:hypothetical protein